MIYVLLKSQKERFKLKNKSVKGILQEKIKIPSFDKKTMLLYEKEISKTLKMNKLNQLEDYLTIFSEIIFNEIQLNEYVLKSYGINDSKMLKSLIYPY